MELVALSLAIAGLATSMVPQSASGNYDAPPIYRLRHQSINDKSTVRDFRTPPGPNMLSESSTTLSSSCSKYMSSVNTKLEMTFRREPSVVDTSVALDCKVLKNGRVSSVRLLRSSGSAATDERIKTTVQSINFDKFPPKFLGATRGLNTVTLRIVLDEHDGPRCMWINEENLYEKH